MNLYSAAIKICTMFVVAISFQGCSVPYMRGYGDTGLSKEDFAVYVENVFTFQNQMTSEVMMLLDSSDDTRLLTDLLSAEQSMHQECDSLNKYVIQSIDGIKPGLMLKRRVEKTASACEKAARILEMQLKNLADPQTLQ